MHTIINTTERRVIVYRTGYADATVIVQDLSKWMRECSEILIDKEDLLSLLHALRAIQGEIEQEEFVPLRWQTDDEPDDGIPF